MYLRKGADSRSLLRGSSPGREFHQSVRKIDADIPQASRAATSAKIAVARKLDQRAPRSRLLID
jgi:hypothetical protein